MNWSSLQSTEPAPCSDQAVLARLLGGPPEGVERLGGGGNSRVYGALSPEWGPVVVKLYPAGDGRTRLEQEYAALAFLADQGEARVPRPLARDLELGAAVYSRLPGQRVEPAAMDAALVDQALDFMSRLEACGRQPGAQDLPLAKEACFSPEALAQSLMRRLAPLHGLSPQGPEGDGLNRFLRNHLQPTLCLVMAWADEQIRQWPGGWTGELGWDNRLLSPSDFGLHNALVDDQGRLGFLDFEYFGWDDPAKTISDFIWHPAMALAPELGARFARGLAALLEGRGDLARRLPVLHPLYGLKWCLILLNEFLPAHLARRRFARAGEPGPAQRRQRQLAKAKALLARVRDQYREFSYL